MVRQQNQYAYLVLIALACRAPDLQCTRESDTTRLVRTTAPIVSITAAQLRVDAEDNFTVRLAGRPAPSDSVRITTRQWQRTVSLGTCR